MRIEVPSGLLVIVARNKEYPTSIDKLLYATERVEKKHNATTENADWFALAFKEDLAAEYEQLGIEGCTTMEATKIREAVLRVSREISKTDFMQPASQPSTT